MGQGRRHLSNLVSCSEVTKHFKWDRSILFEMLYYYNVKTGNDISEFSAVSASVINVRSLQEYFTIYNGGEMYIHK